MWHLQLRAGMPYPSAPSPGAQVPFETALVTLGKASGKLEEILLLLAAYFAAEDRMVLKVMQKAAYPMFVSLAAAVIGPLPLLFTAGAGAYFVTALGGLSLWLLAGGSLLMGVLNQYLARPQFVLDRLLRALVIAVEAGLPLGRAATLAAEASGNDEVIAYVRRVGAKATNQPLAATFRGCPHVPHHALAAMEVADASGDYTGALRKLADLLAS